MSEIDSGVTTDRLLADEPIDLAARLRDHSFNVRHDYGRDAHSEGVSAKARGEHETRSAKMKGKVTLNLSAIREMNVCCSYGERLRAAEARKAFEKPSARRAKKLFWVIMGIFDCPVQRLLRAPAFFMQWRTLIGSVPGEIPHFATPSRLQF
ncbi:hypothetical protein [Rhodosalinus halophilus]|uniref:hypothetical protein n=1 Tax=Rhodosalinus halophilus TaxID=2259333 RepID=UPI0011BE3A6F|nr:hypothetical protein [Rhodosalinus halophilus]